MIFISYYSQFEANSSRTFSNTIFAIEKIEEKFGQVSGVMSLMEMLHPLESLRKESHRQIIRLQGIRIFHCFI